MEDKKITVRQEWIDSALDLLDKEELKEYHKKYYQEHKDNYKEYSKRYREKHKVNKRRKDEKNK